MPVYECDLCRSEPAAVTVSQHADGSTQFVGEQCLPLLGFSLISDLPPELLDVIMAGAGYIPNKATKDARKAAAAAEIDLDRTIAEIVETGPRPDDDDAGFDAVTLADPPAGPGLVTNGVEPDPTDPPPY